MSELVIIERPKYLFVPDAYIDRFEDEILWAYEKISERDLTRVDQSEALPMFEEFDDFADMGCFLEAITSFEIFGDEDYEGYLTDDNVTHMFYEQVSENRDQFISDTWTFLDFNRMSLLTSDGSVFNSPIREVW